MILADSNVFIDFWKSPTDAIINTFANEEVVICGVVRAELLHGARSDKNKKEIIKMLEAFDELNVEAQDWQEIGTLLYKLRTHGVSVPLGDAIIAYIAIKYNVTIWTNDKHFRIMKSVVDELNLYEK